MDVFKISVPNGIAVGTFDNTTSYTDLDIISLKYNITRYQLLHVIGPSCNDGI